VPVEVEARQALEEIFYGNRIRDAAPIAAGELPHFRDHLGNA
jgi:hypothetical protein